MLRILLIAFTLAVVALPAQAGHYDRNRAIIGAGIGAAVGAAIGSEIGGRNEAILGGAIGGAVGVAIATDNRRDHGYRDHRRVRHYDGRGYQHTQRRPGPPHCPPGLAKQGRC